MVNFSVLAFPLSMLLPLLVSARPLAPPPSFVPHSPSSTLTADPANSAPALPKRIDQTTEDASNPWKEICLTLLGNEVCFPAATNALNALLFAQVPCDQQDAADKMVALAKSYTPSRANTRPRDDGDDEDGEEENANPHERAGKFQDGNRGADSANNENNAQGTASQDQSGGLNATETALVNKMITLAQIYAQQPRNTNSNLATPYCQRAPASPELAGLFHCQFAGLSNTTFSGPTSQSPPLHLGEPGTIPFGMSTPLSPFGSCPVHPAGPVPDGVQLVALLHEDGS